MFKFLYIFTLIFNNLINSMVIKPIIMKKIYKIRLFFLILLSFLSYNMYATINASFTYNYISSGRCGAALVSFTNTSTSSAPITLTTLYYGDGFSTNTYASHLYSVGTFCPILAIQNSLGERDTFRITPCIQIFANPSIVLDIDSSSNCNGLVCINNLTNPGAGCTINSVIYDAPGSTEGLVSLSSAARQCFHYPSFGDYSLTVRVTNSCGCVSTVSLIDTIHYLQVPTAGFTSGPSIGCGTSLNVAFTNTSVNASSYIWRYERTAPTPGPLTTFSTALNPSFTFPTGTYNITLVATNAAGCRDSVTVPSYVVVSSTPTIDFTLFDTAFLCGTTSATFRPTTPEVGTYEWTISPSGGASPSTGSSYDFATTITAATTYTVTVTQTLPGGCTATRTRTFPINVFQAPSGSYTISGTCHEKCKPSDTITYTAVSLFCPSGPCSYSWTFPGADAPTTRTGVGPHTAYYTTFGTSNYPLLRITDSRGCQTLYTAPGQIRIVDYVNNINIGATEGCIPLAVPFADLTTVNACDSVVSRLWTFGSAGTSTAKFPIINFTTQGCYPVTLITTTRMGCTDTLRRDSVICVADTPVVTFFGTPDTMCYMDSSVKFTIVGLKDSCYWQFDDGVNRSSLRDTISHLYTDTGVFIPRLQVFLFGCPSRIIETDTIVINYPIASFTDSTSCLNRYQRFFKNTSKGIDTSGGIDSVFWDFGNLASVTDTSSLRNPSYIFPDTGCYSVRLRVWSRTTQCDDEITRNICIRTPIINFTTNSIDTCIGSLIRLTNTSNSIRSGNSTRFYSNGVWGAFGPINQNKLFTKPCLDTIRMINIGTDGCRDTVVKPNYINIRSVTAKINAIDTIGCGPVNACFFDTASRLICAGAKNVLWDFGDPSISTDTSTSSTPCYIYHAAGRYIVTATVSDGKCSAVSNPVAVSVFNPIANFSTDTLHCINNGPLVINSFATGTRPSYSWSFPGGTPATSTLQSPLPVTYSTPGLYTISLTVTDSLGCDSTMNRQVRIYEPIANFGVADSFFVCDGGLITFFDSSFTNICSWTWSFGDGTGSTLQNPSHIYAQPGNYNVQLIVQSCDGCFDTITKSSFIIIKGPSGSFTFSPNRICTNNSVRTIIQSRNASQIYYLTGSNLVTINHSTTIPQDSLVFDTVDFVYPDTGVFYPQLLLSDSSGCNIPYSPNLAITVDSLLVNFGYTRVNICDTATICFTDSSRYLVSGLLPTDYDWDFGDGSAHALVANPCHKFNAPGNYRIRLFVNNPAASCGDSIVTTIRIPFKPIANFSRSDSFQCVSDPIVLFTDLSTPGDTQITRWNWQFRPTASTSSLQNPSFDFTASGTYNVMLTVTDSLGCSDSISKPIYIIANPISNAGSDTTICLGRSTRLNGSGGYTYSWSPATFLSATNISNPLCTPDSTTTYILTATDSAGCIDVDTVTISVSKVLASFSNDTVCFGTPSTFANLSTSNIGSIASNSWNFGDPTSGASNTSILSNPTHVFTSVNSFSVQLITTNTFGCTDDTTMSVPLLQSPISNFTNNLACVRDSTLFTDLSTTSAGTIVSWEWNFGESTTTLDTSNLQNPQWVYSAQGTYNVRLTVRNQGCSKDTIIPITVLGRPTANFTVDTTCIYNSTIYSDLSTSTSGIRNWNWDFGDLTSTSDTSILRNPNYLFPSVAPANYSTRLVVTDSNGCSDDTIRTATIVPLPIASFRGDTLCPGDTMNFADLSTTGVGNINRWHWDFGDLTITTDTSNIRNPRYVYSTPGNYNVRLTTYNRFGCVDDTIIPILVQAPVIANFSMDSVCLGDSMHFVDLSVPLAGTVVSWSWNFSSPPTSSLQNPTYLYTTPGTRVVNLRVTSSFGCVDDTNKTVYVFAKPTARFISDSVCLGDTNHMTSLSTASSFPIITQTWHLTATDSSFGSSASYVYPTGGAHPVTLSIVDGFGCKDDTTFSVTTFTLPTANFSYSGGCGTLPFNFSNTSINGSGGAINAYLWNFDDAGVTSNIASPAHSYADTNTHNVLLVVTDIRGCIDSVIKPITPAVIPNSLFTVSPDIEVCLGVPVCFSNFSTYLFAPIINSAWDFNGDLITDDTSTNICHTYPAAGNYRVTLTVTDTIGCQDTSSIFVRINQPPVANFRWDTTCENTPMLFTDLSIAGSGVINSWNWSFGDASGDVVQNPTHAYADSGSYPVILMIEDDNGCRDTATQNVLVDWQSNVSAFSDTSICEGNSVILHATGGAIYEWTPNLYLDRDDSAYVVATPNTSLNYTVFAYGPYRACPPTTQQITVQVLPAMPFTATASPPVIILGSTSQLTAFPAGAVDSIIWTPDATLTCSDCIDPVSEPLVTTNYVATIYYSLLDAYCQTSDTVEVIVYDQCPKEIFFMPNTFTPNNDGKNDVFYPRGYGVKDVLIFRIFDRWGNLVHERTNIKANDINVGWRGTDKSGSKELNTGVYVYYIEATCTNDDKITFSGNITLIK